MGLVSAGNGRLIVHQTLTGVPALACSVIIELTWYQASLAHLPLLDPWPRFEQEQVSALSLFHARQVAGRCDGSGRDFLAAIQFVGKADSVSQ